MLINTEGESIGKVNGLTVLEIGDSVFGTPARITATVYAGSQGVTDIEREVDLGKSIQFFGARTNLAKTLLLAINGGRCENTGKQMVKGIEPCTCEVLDFDKVMANFKIATPFL